MSLFVNLSFEQILSLSVSDVMDINRSGECKAYYVDPVGFKECGEFFKPPRRTRGKKPKKREKPER